MGIHKAMLGFALAVLMAGHLAVGATVLGQHQSTPILDGGRSKAHGPPETALPFHGTTVQDPFVILYISWRTEDRTMIGGLSVKLIYTTVVISQFG